MKWLFAQHDEAAHGSSQEKGHGRTETTEVGLLDDLSFLEDTAAWRDLAAVARVSCTREINGEVTVTERYFLTSHTDVNALAYAVRAHWDIENSRPWILEVAFDEDASRARTENAQANLVTLRHLALNQLKRDTSLSASIKTKRMRAGWDDDYLLTVLYA